MFSPGRLVLARRRRGLTQAELARRAGVTARRIGDYERGRLEPDRAALGSLAEQLRFPLNFFAAPEPDEIASGAPSFRARKKTTAIKRDAATSSAVFAVEFNRWLESRFDLPEAAVPIIDRVDPEIAAEMVQASWGIELKPTTNMVHLLESRGVRLFAVSPEDAEVDAFSLWHRGRPFIFLNTLTSGERGRFDVAHELGHLVLHSGAAELPSQEAEDEANAFASAFLMPRTSVLTHMPREPLTSQIIEGRAIWRVSAMALTHRLRDLGLLTGDHYRSACVELSQQGFRGAESGGIPRENSQLLTKVLRALRGQRISLADVADELCLPLEDLTNLMLGLSITAVPGTGAGRGFDARRTARRPRLTPITPS
ncbi:ImmA/IrrE family metallo-endopeptidase [Saccharopolyspora sp. ASAGF58]|uniref:helix-turn-helix domain-containing protein n=1 Tax=Saccharopolyspora sp. ASAGF58 TaxID=2719023 RepID=UPI00143FF1B7|nr:XRE family transcriptional regulator [Saccharopolyspora sp. ASAGF58]QIZ35809.1 ImmA/IrrE family metallo-endopeptidase [Saccharopolyspora sp. ASAGF58]